MPGRLRVGGVAASVVLLLAPPAGAFDSYLATGFFADGLTARSSWETILKKPSIQAEFPPLNFGPTFVPFSAVCLERGEFLHIADPRIDNGIRVSAADVVPRQPEVQTATRAYPAGRADGFAVGSVAVREARLQEQSAQSPHRTVGHPVSVYKVIPRGMSTERVFLFDKWRETPPCASQQDDPSWDPRKAQTIACRVMPEASLLRIEPVVVHAGWLDRRRVRVFCDACGEGIHYEREVRVEGRTLCRPCNGERYCTPKG